MYINSDFKLNVTKGFFLVHTCISCAFHEPSAFNPSACKCKLFKQEKDMYDVSLSFNVCQCLLEIHDLSHIFTIKYAKKQNIWILCELISSQ